MRRCLARIVLVPLVVGAAIIGGAGASPPAASEPVTAALRALRPDDPVGYFRLAEELADAADEESDRALPRTLYVLAFALDRARSGAPPTNGNGEIPSLAASCALGLARIERLDRDRRWLVGLAAAIDPRYARPDWNISTGSLSEETAWKAATVLGLARSGEGREARKLFDQPGIADVLRRYERAIGTSGETGALSRLDKYMQAWPCKECNNERVVRRMGDRGVELRLCPECRGNPGPRLSEEELIGQLRFEAALLNGIQRSWAATIIVDQGAPLRDSDPDQLAAYYNVDAAKPYWRDGAWSATP